MSITDEMRDLAALAAEELCDELAEHVYDSEGFGPMLKHPLVFSVPLTLPGLANRALEQKTASLARAIERKDWHTVVFLHERPYRLAAFIDYVTGRDEDGGALPLGQDEDERDLAATVWVDSENIPQCMDDWTALFASTSLWLGDAEEREAFDALPDPITAWRGEIDDGGWSHTTDEKIARFFATRFGANAEIIKVEIPKDKVFGYLTRRGESELLVRR